MKEFNKNIQQKTEKELLTLLADKRKSVKDFRFGSAGNKSKNVKEGMALKKDIARILTKMNASKTTAMNKTSK